MATPKRSNLASKTIAQTQSAHGDTVDDLRRRIAELEGATASEKGEILQLDPESIIPSPFQCRSYFEPKALEELLESIRQYGLVTPLIVRKVGEKYELIGGERRLICATNLKLPKVPVRILSDVTDRQAAELVLVENLKREGISPIEQVRSVLALIVSMDLPGCDSPEKTASILKNIRTIVSRGNESKLSNDQKQIMAESVKVIEKTTTSKWDSFLTNHLSLLDMPLFLQESVISGLPYTKAKAVYRIAKKDGEAIATSALNDIVEYDLSMSQIRRKYLTSQGVETSSDKEKSIVNDDKVFDGSNSYELISGQLKEICSYVRTNNIKFSTSEADSLRELLKLVDEIVISGEDT
jgi:ParB family transcriptional regulator, chromosome partitioning protein